MQYGGGIPAGDYMVHTAVVGGKVNVISVGAVNFPHAGGIAHHHAWSTAGNGFQRGDAEPLIQRGEQKRLAVFHQAFGFAVRHIAKVHHVVQVAQPQGSGLFGKAAAARNCKHNLGFALRSAQHPGKVLIFKQVGH